ncbi:integrase [Methylicorpusculum sp.]|uniref:integrase n=1 Tax=Methylicorpusculum sp. TaxID=2713644 RepID=UPI002731343E|nr:integrase [Methylicorpusculum sp.]MDP2180597.1 integrase [Methylicorpusculum sp.]MDP3528864.1 integrase [Methylicorpusculum sp.]MDZ4151945.1 integrase [Methylicorpusculum sp.]
MNIYPPHIEIIDKAPSGIPTLNQVPWYRSPRLIIFLMVFISSTSISLIYSYNRPAVFQSTATLLTSALAEVDQASKAPDAEHVAIQRQILLSQELLTESIRRLKISHPEIQMDITQVHQILQVQPIPETNLVQMRAEGTEPELLPLLINTWIDVYREARATEIEKNKSGTTQKLQEELLALEQKIEATRAELTQFSNQHDIISTGRDENDVLARLKGLTTSLNNASEDEVKAKAKLEAINKAIDEGKVVVPKQDQANLAALELRLQQLKEKLAEFQKRYTPGFMALQPAIKLIPEEIKKLENEIESKSHFGKQIVHSDAEQEYAAARQTVNVIKEQLNTHKKLAADFSARFTEHERLKTDLEGLEKIYRETQERYVQIETQQYEKYPQVEIVERARLPLQPIKPDYDRDALIAVSGSLLLSLASVWLFDYLTRTQQHQPSVMISGFGIHQDGRLNHLDYQQTPLPSLQQNQNLSLTMTHPRELNDSDLKVLFANANSVTQMFIGLLLCGLSLDETAKLKQDDIDYSQNTLTLRGSIPRTISLSSVTKDLVEKLDAFPMINEEPSLSKEELSALISLAAIDAGLSHPEEITAESIRHTYIVYLVKQGLRLGELVNLVGYLPTSDLLNYAGYSPPRPGCGIDEIETIHPVLAEFINHRKMQSF